MIKTKLKNIILRMFEIDKQLATYESMITGLENYNYSLNERFDQLSLEKSQLLSDNESLTHDYEELSDLYNALKDEKDFLEQLEDYWNNVRTQIEYVYNARPVFLYNGDYLGHVNLDPRVFLSFSDDPMIPSFDCPYDEIAEKARNYVQQNIRYVPEKKELWQFYFETLFRKEGDCDDGAILMAVIMLKSGIPYWRIRLNAGDVQGGGHAYVTYLREADDEWYVLDWCYWAIESKNFGLPWKQAEKYYSDTDGKKGFGIWFSFNTKYIFGDLPKEV